MRHMASKLDSSTRRRSVLPIAAEDIERIGNPCMTLQRIEPGYHRQPQRRPCERNAKGQRLTAELLRHVLRDALIRGGGGGKYRRVAADRRQRFRQPLVVRPEVEATVGNAVRLFDDEQPGGCEQAGQAAGEACIAEPLEQYQQHIRGDRP